MLRHSLQGGHHATPFSCEVPGSTTVHCIALHYIRVHYISFHVIHALQKYIHTTCIHKYIHTHSCPLKPTDGANILTCYACKHASVCWTWPRNCPHDAICETSEIVNAILWATTPSSSMQAFKTQEQDKAYQNLNRTIMSTRMRTIAQACQDYVFRLKLGEVRSKKSEPRGKR